MKIDFVKMNGAGNDFVMIDARNSEIGLSEEQIRWICNRKRGVGSDGVILLEKSKTNVFAMRYFNRNGKEASMCGNGARCISYFAADKGLGNRQKGKVKMNFSTPSGTVEAWVYETDVMIGIDDARELKLNIPLNLEKETKILHFVNTGVPHAVLVCEDFSSLSDGLVEALGREIRNHEIFKPDGANVNFASLNADGSVSIRTYERGVEAETLACGTGSIATAVVFAHLDRVICPVTLRTREGDVLTVTFEKESHGARNVRLRGPVEVNFYGSFEIK